MVPCSYRGHMYLKSILNITFVFAHSLIHLFNIYLFSTDYIQNIVLNITGRQSLCLQIYYGNSDSEKILTLSKRAN